LVRDYIGSNAEAPALNLQANHAGIFAGRGRQDRASQSKVAGKQPLLVVARKHNQ
jgi:hypothetical protein